MKCEICNICCKPFELHETQYDMFPLYFKNWKDECMYVQDKDKNICCWSCNEYVIKPLRKVLSNVKTHRLVLQKL